MKRCIEVCYIKNMEHVYTGRVLEAELFGEVEKEAWTVFEERAYKPYRESMDLVRQAQLIDPEKGFNPSCPKPSFANDLHAMLAEKLELDDFERLRFYTAVHSILDYQHKVDGFFEFDDIPGKKPVIVTLDLTQNPEKTESKADMILLVDEENLDLIENKKGYYAMMDQFVEGINDIIQERKRK